MAYEPMQKLSGTAITLSNQGSLQRIPRSLSGAGVLVSKALETETFSPMTFLLAHPIIYRFNQFKVSSG
jgi:hypothetical protein